MKNKIFFLICNIAILIFCIISIITGMYGEYALSLFIVIQGANLSYLRRKGNFFKLYPRRKLYLLIGLNISFLITFLSTYLFYRRLIIYAAVMLLGIVLYSIYVIIKFERNTDDEII